MSTFQFIYPIQIRYGDLDPQWHVNNARFVTYLEQARFAYLVELGLFDGKGFFDLGLIVADVHLVYLMQIELRQNIQVALRVSRIGNKSMVFEHQIQDQDTGDILATGEIVMVAYDYHAHKTIPVPDHWREKIKLYEHWEETK
ncbi:MAG: acyl-CoA thioesterase [Anaerolineaceae bacterium]|nr:acyl-CoA thioesterase [Anaerolineaceae bacterium]